MKLDEKLKFLRVLVCSPDSDEEFSDDMLSVYLQIAGKKITTRAFPFDNYVEAVPPKYHELQCEIAAYLLSKRGAEGQTSHSENGISRSYENADVPSSMLRAVTPYCGVLG